MVLIVLIDNCCSIDFWRSYSPEMTLASNQHPRTNMPNHSSDLMPDPSSRPTSNRKLSFCRATTRFINRAYNHGFILSRVESKGKHHYIPISHARDLTFGESLKPYPINMYVSIYLSIYLYIYICMYVCMHACMHVCMYVCLFVCMFVCLYVCMFVCVYIYICIYIYIYVYIFTYIYICI